MEDMADLTFEQAFKQLEQVVQQLESEELPLEQSVALFERGMALAQFCERKLDEAEQKVQQLVQVGNGGPTMIPFHAEE
jgi:exodeoxyribonuclease VII small subunit